MASVPMLRLLYVRMTPSRSKRIELYRRVYTDFQASISRFDCGKKCAPFNNGEPVCCSSEHAIPIADRAEFDLLSARSDLWHKYKPTDAAGRKEVSDLHKECIAIECKGARHCERDNRTMACRAFPFFPYMDREGKILGLSHYWYFEDRCWTANHFEVVTKAFIGECLDAFEEIFAIDKEEYDIIKRLSGDMRRTFSRWKRAIPVLHRDGTLSMIEPGTHKQRPGRFDELPKHGHYKNDVTIGARSDAAD
jgi:hypothetical protein